MEKQIFHQSQELKVEPSVHIRNLPIRADLTVVMNQAAHEEDAQTNLAAHVRLARLLLASDRAEQAERHYDVALAILDDGESAQCRWQLLFELALVSVRLGNRTQAVALLRRAVAIEPSAAEAHANLAGAALSIRLFTVRRASVLV